MDTTREKLWVQLVTGRGPVEAPGNVDTEAAAHRAAGWPGSRRNGFAQNPWGARATESGARTHGRGPFSSTLQFYPSDPTQTEAGRWRRLCHRSNGEASEDSDVDA